MKSSAKNIHLTSVDELFSTEESRADATREKVVELPLDAMHPFKNHPFKVVNDEKMQDTAQSIRERGVLVPAIVRPRAEGGYEIVAGHRRHFASQIAGLATMPAIVRDMDDDTATLMMVDSNIQRESLLPSERAFAYRMKLEALKRKAGRPSKENAGQLDPHFDNRRSNAIVAEQAGESVKQVQRFIRLTELIPPLLDMVDARKIAFNPAVELSYNEAALVAILAGEKEHTPRAKRTFSRTEPISLLVDIQAKLRAGKGAGYERWAKKFNAKELAKTLNYLSEAGVTDYADLVQRAETATTRMTELRDAIRQTETRMTEISAMETHIFNYLKTKDVYAAYRASGYARKFAEAHQQELALHRAAKSAFDALGTKKIPSIKALKTEYAALVQRKKQAYQAYRQAREDMRTLLRVRANVETILNDEGKDAPAQTSHRTQDDAER